MATAKKVTAATKAPVTKKAPVAKKTVSKKAAPVAPVVTETALAAPVVAPVVIKKIKQPLDPKVKAKRDLLKQARDLISKAKAAGFVLSIPLKKGVPAPSLAATV